MRDNFFLDSNIIIYALGDDINKKNIAQDLLDQTPFISTQVLTEVSQVCLKKLKLSHERAQEWISLLTAATTVIGITPEIIQHAIRIAKKYQYSFYDSLIISASIQSGAAILSLGTREFS